jgi:hypothetical protein
VNWCTVVIGALLFMTLGRWAEDRARVGDPKWDVILHAVLASLLVQTVAMSIAEGSLWWAAFEAALAAYMTVLAVQAARPLGAPPVRDLLPVGAR